MKKYDSVWYEVYINYGIRGTETIESFDYLSNARKFRKDYLKQNPIARIHIDKWGLRNDSASNEIIRNII